MHYIIPCLTQVISKVNPIVVFDAACEIAMTENPVWSVYVFIITVTPLVPSGGVAGSAADVMFVITSVSTEVPFVTNLPATVPVCEDAAVDTSVFSVSAQHTQSNVQDKV